MVSEVWSQEMYSTVGEHDVICCPLWEGDQFDPEGVAVDDMHGQVVAATFCEVSAFVLVSNRWSDALVVDAIPSGQW